MEKLIAKDLLSIGAVFLRPDQPFTWASGIKSPIYCDNRLTLTAVEVRKHVEAGLAEIVRTKFPEAEVLMGTSTAGIAHAAITATILDMPMGYVRSGQKDHGRGNQIEGKLEKGQKVVVIEDLISTGGSCIEVVNALREAGAEVLGVASIFTYGMKKGLDRLAEANVKNVSLCNLDALVILCSNASFVWPAVCHIVDSAFHPQAAAGGFIGSTIMLAMQQGVRRGLFSNEAGMGSTPHAHAMANVEKPHDQGVVAMVGVFIDTFIVLTLNALVIISLSEVTTASTPICFSEQESE